MTAFKAGSVMRQLFDSMKRHASEAGDLLAVSDRYGQLSRGELFARVTALAADLKGQPRTIGIYAPNGLGWVIAQLACALAGKIVVPLPTFFSPMQLGHVVRDASVELILVSEQTAALAVQSGAPTHMIDVHRSGADLPDAIDGFGQIIYTSGSTGQPKGVRHQSGQIAWSAAALGTATAASATDTYLSVLPLPLLLETLCSIFIPTLIGAYVHFDTGLAEQVGRGDASGIAKAFEIHRPTMSVLVPQLLKHWVAELQGSGQFAPSSLRFVAVGGAPVPRQVANAAWRLGIPVHEGYGLSECCSVVAVNRPKERRPGTVGQPLSGLSVSIDDGEIVVDGPSITDGYLGQGPAKRPWRTGDLGEIHQDGFVTVHGRKDSLLVTSFGRNVSPEWIETMLLADPRIALCTVAGHGEPHLTVLLIPSPPGAAWFAKATRADILELLSDRCSDAPEYGVPRAYVIVSLEQALKNQLLSNGRPVRKAIGKFVLERAAA
ncbi:Long-chain acyl-CoA synthetase (AMP-forming) [Bradyrhizobium erythrophlei]|uniref:Long-chain acyl-CoA synthetase (AMP-forming) n=2 Tax=Bradyrhizobium erythrophlei TaxID=1437360 RepID=A0A1M5SP17_9BRAD|nr:Long-chain acyl-CoA synthetase (AMP-forming) [Bradyrhizobium erythrophlei]